MVTWVDDGTCVLGDTEFLTLGPEAEFASRLFALAEVESTPARFVLFKSSESINRYVELVGSLDPKRIVELGIFRGGSTALFAQIAQPEKLVALDYEPERIAALDSFLERKGLGDTCRAHYGVDQADVAALTDLMEREFDGAPLDLVVDDASHFGPETRTSFNTLFPRLRPGGLYVIEDWSWNLQDLHLRGEPMDDFVYELVRAAGRGADLIAGIDIRWDVITLERGTAAITQPFAVEDWISRVW